MSLVSCKYQVEIYNLLFSLFVVFIYVVYIMLCTKCCDTEALGFFGKDRILHSKVWFGSFLHTVICLSIGTPKNNTFSICSKWKINYF